MVCPCNGSSLRVSARFNTDDGEHSFTFDATPWFESATANELIALYECGYGGDYAADVVATSRPDPPEDEEDAMITDALAHCYDHDIGFEVHVNVEAAEAWLRANRPVLWGEVMGAV